MTQCGSCLIPMLGAVLLLSACTEGRGDEGTELGYAVSALEYSNALNANALNANALNANALNANALNANALNANSLSPGAMAAIQDPGSSGDLSRQLLEYTVSCALDSSQSFSFSWTDSGGSVHNETYLGVLGLAPKWATAALSSSSEGWISACLASRVNWYGVSVVLSSRGQSPELVRSGTPETDAFVYQEGAFWGNLFGSSPALWSCYYGPNVDHSRAANRVCATGYLNGTGSSQPCGMIHLAGSCETICNHLNPNGFFWPYCGGTTAGQVITTFLR